MILALQLSDLDELAQKVRNSYSKNYLCEAIVSYRAGAYRAAIISTWISVCIDIIEKVRELSVSDDGAAKAIEKRLKGIQSSDIAGMLSFERDILNIACDQLQLISTIEKSHLERLKDDRNICAHPTFSQDGSQFSPSPELTRSYIVQAANYLLVFPPVKGKVVIDRLYDLIQEESFPEDDEKAFNVLSSDSYLGRVRESSVRNLVTILIKRLFRDENSISPNLLNRISAALGAIERLYTETYTQVISNKLSQMLAEANDKQLKRVFLFLIKRIESWGKIERAVKVRIEELVAAMRVEELISYRLTKAASINADINDALQRRIENLENTDKQKIVENTAANILKKHAIKIFVESDSFDSAYRNGMNSIVPHAEFLNDNDMQPLFKGVFENSTWNINQILNAGGIDEVFSHLYRATKDNVGQHREIWKNFWDKALAEHHTYEGLKELLAADGVIEIEPAEEEDEDEFPF
jgi:hypothetical protein